MVPDIIKLIVSLGLTFAAGLFTSLFYTKILDPWYMKLRKPFFTPNVKTFIFFRFFLYLAMGLSLYFIWSVGEEHSDFHMSLLLFGILIFLNLVSSHLLFIMRAPRLALVELLMLWAVSAFTVYMFSAISLLSAALLSIHLLWVTFLIVVMFFIVVWNPGKREV